MLLRPYRRAEIIGARVALLARKRQPWAAPVFGKCPLAREDYSWCMSSLAAAGRVAGLSVVSIVAAPLTLFVFPIAIVAAAAIVVPIWLSGISGLAYIGLVSVVVFRAATRRTSFASAALQVLVIDLAALPFAVLALSM